MSEWWYVLVAILAVAVVLVIRDRGRRADQRSRPGDERSAGRDFGQEREVERHGRLDADDQAWEAASQQRNQAIQQNRENLGERRDGIAPDR